jgi:hypothetical protein
MVRRVLPNHLWLVLAILFVQIILNVFGGAVLLYAISGRPGGGLLYFVVWFSLLALVTSGSPAGVTNIAFGFAVISMLYQPRVRAWLTDVRTPPGQWLPAGSGHDLDAQ